MESERELRVPLLNFVRSKRNILVNHRLTVNIRDPEGERSLAESGLCLKIVIIPARKCHKLTMQALFEMMHP